LFQGLRKLNSKRNGWKRHDHLNLGVNELVQTFFNLCGFLQAGAYMWVEEDRWCFAAHLLQANRILSQLFFTNFMSSLFEENEKERRKKYSLVSTFGRCCPWPQVTT